MREKRYYPIIYMFIVTAFFSSIVIGFTQFTRERVEANEQLAFEKAILKALPDTYDPAASRTQMHNIFTEKVNAPTEQTAGAYTLQQNGQINAYALPIAGQGFWAPVKGVIGIDRDKQTITGIAFYEQNETPGLGAEITTGAFTDQFKGKIIAAGASPIDMLRPGTPLGENDVHAITGATQTSTRVEKIINTDLTTWQQKMKSE